MKPKTQLALAALATLCCASTLQAQSGRQANAIWIRDSAKVVNLTYHTSGISASASTARANIVDTAKCLRAQTSWYAHPGTSYVWLHSGMVSTIKTLASTYGYSMVVTEYAGGSHSSTSYHYSGTAFDVSSINGRGVSSSHPSWKTFNQRCRDRGAIESLGPGFVGHSTHVHNAWPRGTSSSSSGGCITQVSAPSNLNATTVDHDTIKLTWKDNSSIETKFRVQRSGSSNTGPWTTLTSSLGANTTSYNANGLTPGKKYWFRVRAENSNDNSPWSNVDNATTKDVKANAPSGLTATAVNDVQINLSWTDNSNNEDGFKIYRSTDGTSFTAIKTVGINVKTFNNTGLAGNRRYWYRVYAYNTAGNSAASNTANDTTPPKAPSALSATAGSGSLWNTINLSWTDNSTAESGFKIERSTASGGPFSQIATNAASDRTFTNTGLAANTTYYYRVRCYNANGNSSYSNTASSPTGNAPPILSAIGNKTVAGGGSLTFTAVATDPNQVVNTTTWQTFQSYGHNSKNDTILFHKPNNSATTSAFQDTSTNYTLIRTNGPTGNGSTKTMKVGWGFKTGTANYWVRLNTFNVATNPNPTIALDQIVRFKIHSSKAVKVGLGIRETGTTAAYGANGGTTGVIEWVGVTNVVSGNPIPKKLIAANTWTTVSFNIPFEPQVGFTGDGVIPQSGKGVLEHLILKGEGGTGAYAVYLDDFAVVAQNTLIYSLDSGAPAGASIGRRNGKFTWNPTTGQVGVHTITVRVKDQGGAEDFETIRINVTGAGNNKPVLATIGNKTVNELSLLSFTATATDPDAGQTLTFSLVGAPSGASISTGGAFTWTPTEAQGPGSYPITVKVTDNGSPASNDTQTITVTVKEVNSAPVMAAISDQIAMELQTYNFTPSVTDSDLPAQTLTYSLISGPEGMTINPSTGTISWMPGEDEAPDTYQVVVRVTDNGVPALIAERAFNLTVEEANSAPVLHVGTTVLKELPLTDFETMAAGTYNGTVLLRQPSFSSSTTNFLNAAPNLSSVTDEFPEGVAGQRTLHTSFSFKTGSSNPWVRLSTFNTTAGYAVGNPTVSLSNKLRFSIYADRAVKLAIGIRETSTTAEIGADGGTTGPIEWVGATLNSGSPNPSRTITAGEWTVVEFDMPNEVITAFPGSGNGVLSSASGKGVLEHLAIVPIDGTGTYNVYVDTFAVVAPSALFIVDTGKTIVLTNGATDIDFPAQDLTFSLEPDAPEGAFIDSKSGTLEWTPTAAQSPSTNTFGIRVTDDGEPALSDVKNVTIVVNKINTAPRMVYFFNEFFVTPGELVEYQASADDDDLPADTLTFSMPVGPSSATLDPVTGMFTWTPSTANGVNYITIRVTDNGTPALSDELTLIFIVSETNNAPTLSLGTARVTEPIVTFESFTNGTPSEQVMFKKPANSATTSAYVETAATNYTSVTTSFPTGNPLAGAKVLRADWSFKTGMSDYWIRLVTANTTFLPNPTINASARVKFDIHTSKTLKVGLGIRETDTTAENGANGGISGAIEYVGVGSKIGTTPVPTRTVNANTWTTLEFDLQNEAMQTLTGNSILSGGQQVLEHLILKGEGGTGAYSVYLDNFEVVTIETLPGTIAMKSGSTLTFTAAATDPESHALEFGLIEGAPEDATINPLNGLFAWTPTSAVDGTTNEITVFVQDAPPGGYQTQSDYQTVTVEVYADTVGTQSAGDDSVAAGETVTVQWNATPGAVYQVQYKDSASSIWTNVGEPITATSSVETVALENNQAAGYYRVVEVSSSSDE
ncbi:MAG: fibronectin type III domain-containing protein [Verrucomicrobia bacterium]|nr:fibronectin type III domain-containing protein [Verrucomicrobiota bacterium]